jgi:hypothetical protein
MGFCMKSKGRRDSITVSKLRMFALLKMTAERPTRPTFRSVRETIARTN